MLHKLFRYGFIIVSIIEVIRPLFEWPIEHYSKPLIMVMLSSYFLTSSTPRKSSFWIILVAIFFSWIGDSLLMYQQNDSLYFLLGLGSFLMAHVAYAISFYGLKWKEANNPLLATQKLRHSLTLILAGIALVSILSPGLGDMRLPVTVYASVIVFMSIVALLRYGYTSVTSFALIFGGAVIFMVSDSILAINKFREPLAYAGSWIMLTYCIAQFMIVQGAIRHLSDDQK